MATLFDPTSDLLSDMIRATTVRHRILSSNLANVETPGYEAQEVDFEKVFAEAREQSAGPSAGVPGIQPAVRPDPDVAIRRDGNTVDLDRQMVKLAENTLWHNGLLQILVNRMNLMKQAIKGQ
jgi:flagellar basal-body rod protein FlgB